MAGGDYSALTPVVPGAIPSTWGRDVRDSVNLRFATTAARDSALTGLGSSDEGLRAYIKDIDWWTTWNGVSWCRDNGTILARGDRQTSSTTTTSEVGVLRVPVGTLVANALYKVETSSLLLACTNPATVGASIRYTTDGTNPTTSSTLMFTGQADISSSYQTMSITGLYKPTTAVNLVMLLTCSRVTGAGNAFIAGSSSTPTAMWIHVSGILDPGDVGVDI